MTEECRRIWLPYVVRKMNDKIGGWIVLNRRYKPLGMRLDAWVDYEDIPKQVRIKAITLPQQKKLFHGDTINSPWLPNRMIWLYSDGSVPTRSPSNWEAYQQRLRLLSSLDCFGSDY